MPDPLGSFAYTWPFYAAFALAYLLWSIPFGLVLTRIAGLGDIRKIGSGNIGATNVLRTGRKGLAAATLLLDGGKGAVAVLIAARFRSKSKNSPFDGKPAQGRVWRTVYRGRTVFDLDADTSGPRSRRETAHA